jgi:hypothetical protein
MIRSEVDYGPLQGTPANGLVSFFIVAIGCTSPEAAYVGSAALLDVFGDTPVEHSPGVRVVVA